MLCDALVHNFGGLGQEPRYGRFTEPSPNADGSPGVLAHSLEDETDLQEMAQ
jgi:hypothetical protein